MTKFHVYFGGVREIKTKTKSTKEIEDIMWRKYGIYANEITRIQEVEDFP